MQKTTADDTKGTRGDLSTPWCTGKKRSKKHKSAKRPRRWKDRRKHFLRDGLMIIVDNALGISPTTETNTNFVFVSAVGETPSAPSTMSFLHSDLTQMSGTNDHVIEIDQPKIEYVRK